MIARYYGPYGIIIDRLGREIKLFNLFSIFFFFFIVIGKGVSDIALDLPTLSFVEGYFIFSLQRPVHIKCEIEERPTRKSIPKSRRSHESTKKAHHD
jgi:hypothetical protein